MRTRKILSIILALAMILTMAPISVGSFSANAVSVDEETVDVNTAQSDELIRPNATVEVTPVTRACYSMSSPLQEASGMNAYITAATPSGVAKNSYTFASDLYAGETPVSTTIKFTPGKDIDASTLNITCSNSSVQLEGPTSPSAGVYVWTVKDGAQVAVSEVLTFTVSCKYVYTDTATGKTYNSDKVFETTGYSYVESVLSPAGIYSHRRVYISYVVGSKNVNRSYVASYLLGSGVYSTSTTKDAFDPNTGSGLEGTTYGKMLYNSTSGTSKYINSGFKADGNRPTSNIYFDTDRGSTLAAQNIRFAAFMPQQSDDSDQKTSLKLAEARVTTGNVQTFSDGEKDSWGISNTTDELGITITPAAAAGVTTVGPFFTIPFGGTGPSSDNGTYTVALNFQTPGYWGGVYTRHSHALTIIKVNKGALRQKILNVVNADVTGPLVTDDAGKGYNPQPWYYKGGGWSAYSEAYAEAQRVCNKPNATSGDIATALRELSNAYDNLVLADADYSDVNFYYNQAKALDKTNYDPSTWAVLENALAEYEEGYSILYQPKLDKIALDIKNAINGLRYADADYTEVEKKVDEINGLIQDIVYGYDLTPSQYYTNWNVVTTALENCGYYYDSSSEAYVLDPAKTKTKQDQAIVDGYPLVLQTAINQLTLRGADYTETRTAISAYSSFKTNIAPYITADSLQAVEDAYSALYALYSPARTIEYQNEIDDAVAALNDALGNYEYRDADYTAAETAKQSYLALDRTIYKDLTAVDAAYNALLGVYGLDARSQATVDNAVKALNNAISKLQKNSADYTAVNAAIEAAQAENTRITNLYKDSYGFTASTFYSNWDAVESAINAVDWNLDTSKQSQVDAYAAAITAAYNARAERNADYTALNAAVTDAYTYLDDSVSAKYTDESIDALIDAVMAVSYTKKISEQAAVDAYTAVVIAAIGGLEIKKADYSAVNTAITAANVKKTQNEQFAAAHHGYPYYTETSMANVDAKIDAVVWNLDITKQSQVNSFATNINNAVNSLIIASADYTDVETAKLAVPADLSVYTDASKAVLSQALSYNTGLKANSQSTVDGFAPAIYAAIEGLKYKSIDNSGYIAAKRTIPANISAYTDETVAAVNAQISEIDTFLAGNIDIRNQADLDAMVAVLNTKIAALELKPVGADYSAVETAKTQANRLLAAYDAKYYTDESKEAVTNAVDAVVYGLLETEQTRVDGFAAAINEAITGLTYKPLDYSGADAQIARLDALTLSDYTDESVAAVNNIITEIDNITPKDARSQSTLDSKVADLKSAIDKLALKTADYSAVIKAVSDANALDKDLYKDFSGVDAAIKAVVNNLSKAEQARVDGFAKAINDAIAALEFKDIDTTAYEAAVKSFNGLEKTIYTDVSLKAVTDQIAAIDTFLNGDVNISNQAQLDSMVSVLNSRIGSLVLKGADYSKLNEALNEFAGLDESLYTNYEESYDVYATVRSWKNSNSSLKADQQNLIDAQTALMRDAIDALILKSIDTSAYEAAKATIPADLTNYTADSVKAVEDQIAAIDTFLDGDVNINDQATLDAMVADLNTKIAALALKGADYTALNAVIDEFLDLDESLYTNYDDAYDVYLTVKNWKAKNGSLQITDQNLVDAQTATLREAIDGLIPVGGEEEYFGAKAGSTTKIAPNLQITGLKTELSKAELEEIFLDTNMDASQIRYTKAVRSAKYYGTGSTITVTYKDGKVEVYTIIIYGDVDGNGLVNYTDAGMVALAAEDNTFLDSVQQKAGNVDGMRRITATDAASIYKAADGDGFNQLNPAL